MEAFLFYILCYVISEKSSSNNQTSSSIDFLLFEKDKTIDNSSFELTQTLFG